jgi:hypothetical protein
MTTSNSHRTPSDGPTQHQSPTREPADYSSAPRRIFGSALLVALAIATYWVLPANRADRLAAAQGVTDNSPNLAPAPAPGPASDRPVRPVLNADDIQKIRRAELQASDNTVRIQISADTRKSFCDKTGENPDRFRAMTPAQQAVEIMQKGDDVLRSRVRINSDPRPLAEFRRLQTQILVGCATTACHGGRNADNLMLINPAIDDAGTYTNFYLLQLYSTRAVTPNAHGIFGGEVVRKLIQRGDGDNSLLVNYALPTGSAHLGLTHPPVNGSDITPILRSRQDPRCKEWINWMNTLLSPTEPDYKITDYSPPATGPAATQPAPKNP